MFFEILVSVETALVSQVVLTLRSVFFVFNRDGFMLITAERNRIYAITRKNRIITSLFCVITISQFILGLYLTVYVAMRGGAFVTSATHDSYLYVSAQPRIPISLPVYMVCMFAQNVRIEIGFTALSLAYGAKPLCPSFRRH